MMPTPPPPSDARAQSTLYELGRESAETRAQVRELQTWRSTVVDPFIETVREMRDDVKTLVEARDERKSDAKALQTDVRTAILGAIPALITKSLAPAPYQDVANWIVVGCAVLIVTVLLLRRRD